MYTGLSDIEIISLILKGQQQSYATLVDRYKNYVFTLALRFTNNREDAEEVAQDIFVKAYRSLADFRGGSKFSTWLYTITYNTSITFLRKKKLQTRSLDDENTFMQLENQDSGMKANMIETKSRAEMVNRAIALLSPDDAQILTYFYIGEQSLEEIGQVMMLESNTVKVRLHRARQRLKEKMEKFFQEELKSLQND